MTRLVRYDTAGPKGHNKTCEVQYHRAQGARQDSQGTIPQGLRGTTRLARYDTAEPKGHDKTHEVRYRRAQES